MTDNNSTELAKTSKEELTNRLNSSIMPSKEDLDMARGLLNLISNVDYSKLPPDLPMDSIIKTDSLSFRFTDALIEDAVAQAKATDDYKTKSRLLNIIYTGICVSDMSNNIYDFCSTNENNMSYWISPLVKAMTKVKSTLKVPRTQIIRLPHNLAQFMRLDYMSPIPQSYRDTFNKWVFDHFNLDLDKTYFIKLGNFSSKFEFRNCKVTGEELKELGSYYHLINNNATTLVASTSTELVVRDFIEDVENNPTIYHGMPLRSEFRFFIDCDTKEVIGGVPYWHPVAMERYLYHLKSKGFMVDDYDSYVSNSDKLLKDFELYRSELEDKVKDILQNLDLEGQWSLDIMKNGDDFYIIDMAVMQNSALVELLKLTDTSYSNVSVKAIDNYMKYGNAEGTGKYYIDKFLDKHFEGIKPQAEGYLRDTVGGLNEYKKLVGFNNVNTKDNECKKV